MRKTPVKTDFEYVILFQKVTRVLVVYRQEHIKSPTIAEIAYMVGDSEESVLECLEFGSTPHLLH